MPRFVRRPVSTRVAPTPGGKNPSGDEVANFVLSVIRTQVAEEAVDSLTLAVKKVVRSNSAPNVIDLVTTILDVQVGEDEAHSPMLRSLVDDLGVEAAEVELAQDIILAGRDITRAIARAVNDGNPQAVVWELMSLMGQLIPELQDDINALKK